jgi:serine/threonine protein kinase
VRSSDPPDIDLKAPPFDRLRLVRPLATNRGGRESASYARHQLYAARDRATLAQVLVKLTTRPGVFYEQNLANEIENLRTLNRALPDAPAFPVVVDDGRLRDGRRYLVTYFFDELPLATVIDDRRVPSKTAAHLRTGIAVADALIALHTLPLYHVDLNPMNILYRSEWGRPVVRIVDFESSFDPARHAAGVFYDPPTTPGYSAPEVTSTPPDGRADVFSVGAVIYTLLTGFGWTWKGDVWACIEADAELEPALRDLLARAVAPDRSARYATMAALRDALTTHLDHAWFKSW